MRMYSEMPKTTNVQTIRPTFGVISHEDELEAIGTLGMAARACIDL